MVGLHSTLGRNFVREKVQQLASFFASHEQTDKHPATFIHGFYIHSWNAIEGKTRSKIYSFSSMNILESVISPSMASKPIIIRCIRTGSYYIQISVNTEIKIIKLVKPCLQPFWANKTGVNVIILHFKIRGKAVYTTI